MELIVHSARQVMFQVKVGADSRLIVAVSGGIDSIVLLDILDQLRGELGYQLHLAHFDHALRPESSADGRFVAEEASRRGLPCTVERRDVGEHAQDEKLSLEEAGRLLRYAFFEEVAGCVGASFVVLGHHAEDQAETVLMRLLRGSGATGLGAMEVVRKGRYLRPLLSVRRTEIETYAQDRGLRHREDASNLDMHFLRNRIRWELLPLLEEYNPKITETLNRTARLLKDEDHLLSDFAEEAITAVVCESYNDKITLDSSVLVDYHIAVQRRVVRAVLQGLSAAESPFNFAVVEQILDWIRTGDKGLHDLSGGLRCQGNGSRYFLRRGHWPPVESVLTVPGAVALVDQGIEIRAEIVSVEHFVQIKDGLGAGQVAFDADRLGAQVQLRSTRPGDRFRPLGMVGHKKLSDLLIDAKWPRILRDEILVLAQGEDIAWVLPLRSSHTFRVDSATRRVALCQFRRRTDNRA